MYPWIFINKTGTKQLLKETVSYFFVRKLKCTRLTSNMKFKIRLVEEQNLIGIIRKYVTVDPT